MISHRPSLPTLSAAPVATTKIPKSTTIDLTDQQILTLMSFDHTMNAVEPVEWEQFLVDADLSADGEFSFDIEAKC